jgi:hypothetical protein
VTIVRATPATSAVPLVTAPRPPPSTPIPPQLRPNQIARLPPAQSDLAYRLSLASFVSQFEEGKSFNETELSGLGLDLHYDRPILPLLHSVLSEAPLAGHSWHGIPEHYREVAPSRPPQDKVALFSEQTLLFIFETEPRSPLQAMAADELARRGFVFDEEAEKWRTPNRRDWDTERWREAPATPPEDATRL